MPEKEPKDEHELAKGANNYVKFTGLAFQMVAIIGIFTYAGYRIDAANNHQIKWVTALLALTGVFISLYTVFKSIRS